jgi:hypothetical protein
MRRPMIGWLLGATLCMASTARAQPTEHPPEGGQALPPQEPPAASPGPTQPTGPDGANEEADIAAELARIQSRQAAQQESGAEPVPAEPTGDSASSRGLSNLMNPALSANGLLLAGGSSRPQSTRTDRDDLRSGIVIQEVELRASAVVDPYLRADVTFSGNADDLGFEEAYLTTLEIPRLTIRAGQMYAALGRHNGLHTHAFPFLTAPLPWRALLGPEGLADPGVSADLLLPLPFYAEINAQVFQGEWRPLLGGIPDDPTTPVDETVPDRRRDEDLAYVGHLKTLFDLSDSTTVELGGTYVGGRNGFAGWTSVVGGDLTLKWRPIEAERYRGLDWTTEILWVDRPRAPVDRRVGGGYSALRAQFAQRWWVQVRGAVLGIPKGAEGRTWRGEALVAFVPSEFSALRLQYALDKATAADPVHELFLQAIFSIGPHPSHAY